MRSQRKGLAQFFGGIRAEKCTESIAENLCLTLLKRGRLSIRVNGYRIAHSEGEYVFSSNMRAKGLLRFASPRPIIDRSEFSLDGDAIIPNRFAHEDGSRKGEDNHTIEFDWGGASATVSGDGYSRDIALTGGVLDRGTLQVALMLTLANGDQPETFEVLDENAVDTYAYEFVGEHTIETEMGEIDVLRYRQQRAGSSRYTIIDLAPSLDYVPARIEQMREGESRSAFLIESIERL